MLVGFWLAVSPVFGATVRRSLGDGLVATLTDDDRLLLEAKPQQGEGLFAFTRRLTGATGAAGEIAAANGNPRRLLSGVRYKVPYENLTNDLKLQVVQAIFTYDRPESDGWRHVVPSDRAPAPTLWQISEWFTGAGRNFSEIRDHNGMMGDTAVRPGQELIIPRRVLRSAFLRLLPEPVTVIAAPAPPRASGDPSAGGSSGSPPSRTLGSSGQLTYIEQQGQRYAVYRLRRGEALYSAVVVRFTGVLTAREVNGIAADLARQNAIYDVTDMPVGQPVKIPLDLLLPEYLPAGDPKRVEWENNQAESAKYSNTVRASSLKDITVILDAGHGGDDPGVDYQGTWESTYVYDVMLRVKRLLETTTGATVVPTTRDGAGFSIVDRDVLPSSRGHRVLTQPEYAITDVKVSANLRWYLANSRHRQAVRASGDEDKTIFLSLHADSLHHSLRGAMVYVPATSLTVGEYGKSGSVYTSRKEVREKPRVNFSWKERTKSEGLSRQFAQHLLTNFRRNGLRVHKEKPIRDRIIRCRRCRPFVPAVVRRNAVPAKVLLEICNINNPEDRAQLRTRAFRQKVALSIVDSILVYYGQEPLPRSQRVASGGASGP